MRNLSHYLRIKEAAEVIGVSEMTLRRWDDAGKLVARRHPSSNYRLYRKQDLEKFLRGIK